MKFHIALISLAVAVCAKDASSTWTTLTPSASPIGTTNYAGPFGIAVEPVESQSSTSDSTTTLAKRDISDGQVQATTTSSSTTKESKTSTDSSEESKTSSDAAEESSELDITAVSCKTDGTLQMSLEDSILYDSHGRVGSIVANRQFQFDGPPPQAGAIYAAGWSITDDGYLALGDSDIFYQCLSGTFYNLYDESIGGQCTQIRLEIVRLIDC
ncbi:uncharacterized protein CYBJADRAFT_190209 [Cyberlindnera jadinii NRRL Y-1542]|uniref:Cell wall mannoprotein PIR1-like C-terminal domain-containing protein n=1 Tax=Cyberlindnera jadinii (strain ATCC 18201 / CBS 1600 / BCRC 20928 / JCM 3617 / NBRC 0987 / NRRL Y-1542) TaxID=983966 RepID=A0A1E4S115_CYBJN|nr:hypothetical protein CYBJADRAFT_190209 [Cyberlindnera jadinii NRRL Y-1542]ODV73177.1 hypothetical protein CYBJADRAFT_190209 [Cyberlindnera jadinii NRRL Y-1542]